MYWTDERKEKCVLLLCGFGTGDADEMERTYGRLLKEARKAVPSMSVRLALTSPKVIGRLHRKSGIRLPDVRYALEEIAAGGAEEVRILPVQVVGGSEYEKLKELVDLYKSQIKIRLDSPLLAGPKTGRVADLLAEEAASRTEEAIVYVGHGTHGRSQDGPAAYRKLEEMVRSRTNSTVFIGELQTGPAPIIKALSEKAFRRILLCSLMMVSGHHWAEDVTGEKEESWKNALIAAGYEVTFHRASLLERKEIRDLLIE